METWCLTRFEPEPMTKIITVRFSILPPIMIYKSGQFKSLEEAKEYNRKVYEPILKGESCGCIATLACEHCFALITDSICLCVSVFYCPECGKRNGKTTNEMIKEFILAII
jgi:hypothetical protein